MLLKQSAKISKTYKACFGVLAIVLIIALLAACGSDSDSGSANDNANPDQTTTSTSSEQSSAAAEQSQGTASEQTLPPETTFAPETTLSTDPTSSPEDGSGGGFANLGESLNNVLEAVLEEEETEPQAQADISVIVNDGEIVEGETRYEVALGQNIIIEVFSSEFNQEVHVHGYDLTEFAGPISPARFEFVADLAGTWEVEFEETSQLIFELVVR